MTISYPEPPKRLRKLLEVIGEAVSVNWDDLISDRQSGLLQVEYESGEHDTIDWLKVWSSTKRGYWNLVCEYWMHEHPFGKIGLRFGAGYESIGLGASLDTIMQNQQMFAPPEDMLPRGLIQVDPPRSDRQENVGWRKAPTSREDPVTFAS